MSEKFNDLKALQSFCTDVCRLPIEMKVFRKVDYKCSQMGYNVPSSSEI